MKQFGFILFLLFVSLHAQAGVVLIDPGHGGEDCGAKAQIWKDKKLAIQCEKDIALEIAKRIHSKLNKTKHIKAYLTRTVDSTLTLQQRADYADKIGADIFISIHLNSSHSRNSNGVETYYLDNHDNAAVKKIEKVENSDAKGEQVIINQILADLVIQRTAPISKKLAFYVHANLQKRVIPTFKLADRGTKAALFYVLALSKRPSILLEAGFLSNQEEVEKLLSEKFQEEYAEAVYKGVVRFFGKPKKKVSLF